MESALNMPGIPAIGELRRLSRMIQRAAPELSLAGHRVVIHDIHPHNIAIGHRVKEHVHSFYEGHILLDGHATYISEGEQAMGPGGSLLHAPRTVHAWREPEHPCLRLLIWFSMDPVVPVPRPAQWPMWPDILWDVALLFSDAGSGAPGWPQRASARLGIILSRLLTIAGWPPQAEAAPSSQTNLVALVDQFMRDNLALPLTLDDIANLIGVSQRTLCRQFTEQTGETVMQYLHNLRMERAATLLVETDISLAAIGEQIGLPDPSYFSRRFRAHFHLMPSIYRKQRNQV